jgi:hypothetical protein
MTVVKVTVDMDVQNTGNDYTNYVEFDIVLKVGDSDVKQVHEKLERIDHLTSFSLSSFFLIITYSVILCGFKLCTCSTHIQSTARQGKGRIKSLLDYY